MTNQTIETIIEPAKETAKKIRAALKANFPGVKFSVRTDVYSMGSSINIQWTDLPLSEDVEKVVNQFKSGSFNGMDDYYETTGYVMDGKCYIGAKYIFCKRNLSDDRREEIKSWMKENYAEVNENSYDYYFHFNKAELKMMEELNKPAEVETIETVENNDNVIVEMNNNEELNGIELKFTGKPSEGTRQLLKDNGYRWSKYNKVWYIKNYTKTDLLFAESFVSAFNDITIETEENDTNINNSDVVYVESIQEETKPYKPNTAVIERIEKAVSSLQKKLDNISGHYLTNTWKRMKEEESRQRTREQLQKEIDLLNYLHSKVQTTQLSLFEETLITGSFRTEIDSYYRKHYEYKHEIEFPVINYKYDLNGWYNKEVPTKQSRLRKGGINNTVQLLAALEIYKTILSEIDKPIDFVQHKIKKLESEAKFKNIPDYFPTPQEITDQLIDLADIEQDMSILEPSAGNGNIMDSITKHVNDNNINVDLKGMEINFSLLDILKLKNYEVEQGDFLTIDQYNTYDRIIMNPPFSNLQDIDHVLHAYECLKEGGRIVAIMSEGAFFRTDKKALNFRELLSNYGYSIDLESGAFKDSGTMVKSRIVVIDKPIGKSIAI